MDGMNSGELTMLDRRAVRAAFGRAAQSYDAAAVLQREIADRLLARLEYIRLAPQRILDLGCGTGYLTRQLARQYPRVPRIGLDLAWPMARAARQRGPLPWGLHRIWSRSRFVVADAEALPLATASVDLIISSLTLQWCDPERVFAECRRVLRPGGLLLFTTFGPDTLTELRSAWRAADSATHVHDFLDMHDVGDALVRTGFADPVMDVERLTLTYAEVTGLLRDLKAIGAHNAVLQRAAGLTGKARYARFSAAYESFRNAEGRLPASYEVVYGHAWAGETGGARPGDGDWKPISLARRP